MNYIDHTCLECKSYICKNRKALGMHLSNTHKMSSQDYILKHDHADIRPVCACGCKQETSWDGVGGKFRSYVSGHNEAGFRVKKYVATPEVKARRAESIRKTYELHGEEIKKKISKSVNRTVSQPGYRQKLSEAQKLAHQDPLIKKKISDIRKRVWAERHDELYDKIFTKEFREKISAANMRRDIKRQSKAEIAFFEKLVEKLKPLTVMTSRWVNAELDGTQLHKCFDGYIPEKNALIEFDGTYWHARDRTEDYTLDQLSNITSDLRKSRLAAKEGFTLVRVGEDVPIESIDSYESLLDAAHHVQLGTKIVKDGRFRFIDDHHAIVSREKLIRTNEIDTFPDAEGRIFTENMLLPLVRDVFREHVACHGWFYPTSDETLHEALTAVSKHVFDASSDVVENNDNAGSMFLKSMFRSFWDVDKGPVRSFHDDEALDRVLRYRLGLNNSKPYDYVLSDGMNISCRETFDINIKNIRTGFIVQRAAVSWFKPATAAELYKRLLPAGIERPVVWDPSCGFGARMLGFFATFPGGRYIGTDPATQTSRDLTQLASSLSDTFSSDIELHCTGSECFAPAQRIDLAFTSIPFFDREKYFDEDTQCWKRYPVLSSWIAGYLIPTLSNAKNVLVPGGRIAIHIDEKNAKTVVDAAASVGLVHEKTCQVRVGRDHFSRKHMIAGPRTEPVLVFVAENVEEA